MGKSKFELKLVPNSWIVLRDDYWGVFIQIKLHQYSNQGDKFVIMSGDSFYLNKNINAFCLDMKNDDVFFKETRFDSLEEAKLIVESYINYCLSLDMCSDFYQMAIQYNFNNKQVKAPEKVLKQLKEHKKI